jgi:hypothetical protein
MFTPFFSILVDLMLTFHNPILSGQCRYPEKGIPVQRLCNKTSEIHSDAIIHEAVLHMQQDFITKNS